MRTSTLRFFVVHTHNSVVRGYLKHPDREIKAERNRELDAEREREREREREHE